MAGSSVLRDDLDIDIAIRSITAEATPMLASALHAAGPLYPWDELLPGLIARLLDAVLTTGEPSLSDHRAIVAAARRCARDWVPLQELERCCQIVLACAFRHLWQVARPRAVGDLLRLSGRSSAVLPVVLTTTRRAYVEEMGRAGVRRAESMVIATLLEGGDAASLARETRITLPERSVAVYVTSLAADRARPAERPAERRAERRALPDEVSRKLRELLGDNAVCAPALDGAGLIALVPVPTVTDPEAEPAARALGTRLAEAFGAEHGGEFVTGLAFARRSHDAATAVREALAVGDVLARTGSTGQASFLLDIMLEAVLSEGADLRERLLARLGRVRAQRRLWATLRALYTCDLDRGRTARRLGIHRSTLDYRLNRIERLTGISPTTVRGIVLYSAGLAAAALGP